MNVQDATLPVVTNRYVVQTKLGQGGMGIVYRALDRLTGQPVALKRVTLPTEYLRFTSFHHDTDYRLSLAQEFRILASLRHPNVISVLDYGFYPERQPFFTMELLEDAQTVTEYGKSTSVSARIETLLQVIQALAYLHRRGILHRDLKPDNTLVVNGHVKVLDFGLAVAREHLVNDEEAVGTFAYMAPELLFQTAPASEASDLYAVGVMAFELFAGHHPFSLRSFNQLIDEIGRVEPAVQSLDIDEKLQTVLARLLAKSPNDRYRDADELLRVYVEVTGLQAQHEPPNIRESYLQAARFVGREKEYAQLTQVLEDVLATQHGAAWLIGGESGVGKSRFVDELRILALVKGAQVLQGQTIREKSESFWMWRGVLRRLCLSTPLDDFQASVLKTLLPDIEGLLDRPIPDAPNVDPQATQLRLLTVIEDLFLKQDQVTVLLLEDLQWANESLEILKRLVRMVSSLPLMIIATYRDDERPGLPGELSQMQHLPLKKLDKAGISDLSASIIGESGRDEPILDLLQRETEGNILFIIEVIRALAESAGQLSRIVPADLPPAAVSIGTILQRRLERIPDYAQPLLRIAAVAGRELDLDVLRVFARDIDLDTWLETVSYVLEVQDNRYRFAHDKLREEVLALLTVEQQRSIHRDLAQTLEKIRPDNPAILAYHWREANEISKEAFYTKSAGLKALEAGAYREAISFLERGLELAERLQRPARERADLEYQIGMTFWSMGLTHDARQHFEHGLSLLGYPIIHSNRRWSMLMIQAVATQAWHRVKMDIFHRTWPVNDRSGEFDLAARITTNLSIMYSIAGMTLPTLYTIIQNINWAELAGPSANDIAFTSLQGFSRIIELVAPPLAPVFSRRAAVLRPSITDRRTLGEMYRSEALMVGVTGDWENSTVYHEESLRLAREIRDYRLLLTGQFLHLLYAFYFSPTRANLMPVVAEINDLAVHHNDLQSEAIALSWQIILEASKGEFDEARAVQERKQAFLDSVEEVGAKSYVLIAAIELLRREGHLDQALEKAEELLAITPTPSQPAFIIHLHILNEIFFTAWEATHSPHVQKQAARTLNALRGYAQFYPIGRPLLALYKAWHAGISGKTGQFQKEAKRAIELSQRYRMPFVEGLARYHVARFLRNADPVWHEHMTRAKTIFDELDELWYSQQAQEMLTREDD